MMLLRRPVSTKALREVTADNTVLTWLQDLHQWPELPMSISVLDLLLPVGSAQVGLASPLSLSLTPSAKWAPLWAPFQFGSCII